VGFSSNLAAATGETLFNRTFSTKALIPGEIKEPHGRVIIMIRKRMMRPEGMI